MNSNLLSKVEISLKSIQSFDRRSFSIHYMKCKKSNLDRSLDSLYRFFREKKLIGSFMHPIHSDYNSRIPIESVDLLN